MFSHTASPKYKFLIYTITSNDYVSKKTFGSPAHQIMELVTYRVVNSHRSRLRTILNVKIVNIFLTIILNIGLGCSK